MTDHQLSYEKLIDFATGQLQVGETKTVQDHVDTCAPCRGTLARFHLIGSIVLLDATLAAPPTAIERAKKIGRPGHATGVFRALRRILAAPTYDSRQQAARAGLRGGSDDYMLSFAAEGTEVDLQIEPSTGEGEDDWQIIGEVSSPNGRTPLSIGLARASEEIAVVATTPDNTGTFTLAAPSGAYDMMLAFSDEVIVLPNIELR